MPGMDGTGPRGMGPMTGGARGWCNPVSQMNAGYGPNPGAPCGVGSGYPYGGYAHWGMMPGYGMGLAWGRGRAPFGHGRGMAWGRGGGFGMGRGFGRW